MERVENLLEGLRASASGPKPGHLHLTSFSGLIWSNRPYTFVAGLDADTFPGKGCQDPVLLDRERRQIHPGLPLRADRPEENRVALFLALASRSGRVTLSFPSFDIIQNRQLYPSSVLLQLYRLLKEDPLLDFTDLMSSLGKPAGFCPRDSRYALDEVEWWAGKVLNKPGIRNGAAAVRACYRGIELGQLALEARNSPEPTEYDGVIDVHPGELDPRQKDLTTSCSRLEYLAGCPFAYFLKYLLNIYPPQEVVYDPERWLGNLDRGSLLHELFCSFMRKVTANGEQPELAAHRMAMIELADELIEDYRERIPPPSELVYSCEVREIYLSCEVFLAAEEADYGGVPVLFEVPFGFGAEAVKKSGCGLAEPVEIELEDGTSFLLNGKIDRIDRVGDGVYHLWDYKTGSTYGYADHSCFCSGRQVQHALYAIAAEQILKDLCPGEKPRVELSGYYFPAVRGEGRQVAPVRSSRSELFQVLNNLFDILNSGSFVAADDQAMCGICDYQEVCGGESAAVRAKQLLKAGASCLEPWRRLKSIE